MVASEREEKEATPSTGALRRHLERVTSSPHRPVWPLEAPFRMSGHVSGKKRVWMEFQEDNAVAEVKATVNQSATTCGDRLRTLQKIRDDEALASAREERRARSARVFEGDAGLSDGIVKVKEQIVKLMAQLEQITAALASPLATGEVEWKGRLVSRETVEVRRTAIKEELSRLQMAVQAISLKGPSMLALVRKLAAEGDVRGEIVPPRGPRPRGLLCPETPSDTIVHHYVGLSLPTHLCMAAELGDPEDLDDEALHRMMTSGPRLLIPGPRPKAVRLALHADLEAALGAAHDDDEIHLPPGTFAAKSLSRLRESLVISGSGKEHTVLVNDATDDFFVEAAAASLTLRHLTLRSRGGTEGVVRVTRGGAALRDCIVDCAGFEGVRVLGTASLTMTGCVVSGAASAGLQVLPGARVALEQCVVLHNGMGGEHWVPEQGGIQVHIQFSTNSVDRQLLKPSPTLPASHPPQNAAPPSGDAEAQGGGEGGGGSSSCGGGGSSSSGGGGGGGSMLHPMPPLASSRGTSLLGGGGGSPSRAARSTILQEVGGSAGAAHLASSLPVAARAPAASDSVAAASSAAASSAAASTSASASSAVAGAGEGSKTRAEPSSSSASSSSAGSSSSSSASASSLMPPPPLPSDRGGPSGTAAAAAGASRDRISTDETLPDEGTDAALKAPALLSLVGCKIVRNRGAPIVFCQPNALLALGRTAPGQVPEGACVWLGRGNTFEGSPSRRYGMMAIEEQSMKAPKLQLTPRMTPIVTPAKLPSLIPTLALSPQLKRLGKESS